MPSLNQKKAAVVLNNPLFVSGSETPPVVASGALDIAQTEVSENSPVSTDIASVELVCNKKQEDMQFLLMGAEIVFVPAVRLFNFLVLPDYWKDELEKMTPDVHIYAYEGGELPSLNADSFNEEERIYPLEGENAVIAAVDTGTYEMILFDAELHLPMAFWKDGDNVESAIRAKLFGASGCADDLITEEVLKDGLKAIANDADFWY